MKPTGPICVSALLSCLLVQAAWADQIFHYSDTWIDWPGYTSQLPNTDENGTPKIASLDVTLDGSMLTNVTINLNYDKRQLFDSLFISSDGAWDSWDYFVISGADSTDRSSTTNGTIASDGLWDVATDYTYTITSDSNSIRQNNPNGIDQDSLSLLNGNFAPTYDSASKTVTYDFSGLGIRVNPDSFFVAYAPWCANDVIGGGTAPVPEPATMLLFGTGLVGLVSLGRKKMRHA